METTIYKMFTKREHELVEFILRALCKLYLFPHEMVGSKGQGVMHVTTSRKKEFFVRINCVISFLYGGFLILRLFPSFGYEAHELKRLTFETLFHYFWMSVHCTCFAIQLFGLQFKAEFAYLYNQIVKFNLTKGENFQ